MEYNRHSDCNYFNFKLRIRFFSETIKKNGLKTFHNVSIKTEQNRTNIKVHRHKIGEHEDVLVWSSDK